MADLTDVRVRAEHLRHALCQPCGGMLRLLQHILLVENVKHSECRRTAERIACIRMRVHKRLALAPIGVECLIDFFFHNSDRHRHIAARQAFRETHEVGGNACTLARKEPPRAPEARRNLVRNEENVVLVAEGAQLSEILLGIDAHPRAPLQERLDDHRRRLLAMRGECTLRVLDARAVTAIALFPIRTAIAVGCFDVDVVHHHGFVHLGKEIHAPDRERTDGLAMVALREAHEARLLRAPRLLAVLERHLERRLDRRRTVVIEVELCQPCGHEIRQTLRKLDRRTVGEICKDDMLETV